MFVLESTLDGAGTIVETGLMTNSEAGANGEAVKFSSGKLTKCDVDDAPQAILIKTTSSGTNVVTEFIRIRRDQIWLADYTGTAPVVGVGTYGFDSTAKRVDGDNTSGGEIEIVSVDTTKSKCRVKFLV